MHHVKGCDATARCQSIAIDFVERAPEIEVRILFDEGRRMLPVDGEPVTIKHVRPRENVRPAPNAAQLDAAASELPQPSEGRRVLEQGGIASSAHEDIVEVRI